MPNRTVAVELKAIVANYVAGMQRAAQATSQFADKASRKLEENRERVSRLGTGFAVVGAGMVLAAGKAINTYADFDKQMAAVASTGDDAKKSLGALREQAIQLGADTQYTASEAAQGIENLMKAGVSATDVLNGGLSGALDLAAAGELSVADAAENMAITLAQFGKTGKDATHVADLLAAGAGKASGEVSDMAMALKQSGLVANQTGLTIEETTGALAGFAQAGLIGSDSGTSFKTMLQRLTPQSKEAKKQFDELGISAYDSSGKFVGLANFAGQLRDKMQDLSPKARNAAMNIMFGSDAVRASTELYNLGAEGVQKWIDAVNDQGYAQRRAAELTNNLAGDIERLGGSIDTVFIRGGSGANAVLRNMAQGAEAAVDAIGNMPEPLLNVVTLLTGAGGLASLGVGGLLKLAGAAADAKANFKALGISAKVAKLSIAGIGTALAIGTIALAAWADQQAQAKANTDSLATTLVVLNGQVTHTRSTTEALSQAFETTGTSWFGWGDSIAKLSERLGVSQQEMIDYTLGNADAHERLSEKLRLYRQSQSEANTEGRTNIQAARDFQSALDGVAGSLTEAEKQAMRKAEADKLAGSSATSYGDAVKKSTEATDANTAATSENASVLNDWIQKQWAAADAALSLSGSQIGWERALDTTRAAMKKLVKETKNQADLTDINTKAGQDAKTVLDQTATATLTRVKTLQKAGAAETRVAAVMERGRKAFVAQAREAGFTETQISRLVAKYDLLPENVTTEVGEDGSSKAETRVDNLFAALKKLPKKQQAKVISEFNDHGIKAAETALNRINGKTATTYVNTVSTTIHRSKGTNIPVADGGMLASGLAGIVQQFASGGFGQPQIRPYQGAAGVQWGEKGSGPWEAFISGAPQKRARSIAIWRQVGQRLLGSFSAEDLLQQFASGGITIPKEPTYKGKKLSYWQDHLKSTLEVTRLRIQIRELLRDLRAHETYVGKDKKKHKRPKLRGIYRTEARQDLAETEREYDLAVEARKLNSSKRGSIAARLAAWEKAREAAEKKKDAAAEAAEAKKAEQADRDRAAADASSKWQAQFMQGSSAADLLANMQAGATSVAAWNDLLGQLDKNGLSDSVMSWLWEQGPASSAIAKQILAGGKDLISAFNTTSGNLAKASDAAGRSQATGSWVKSPVLTAVNLPGYMTSGATGAVVGNKTINFNISQSDPYAVAVAVDQQLRYL